MFSQRVDQTPFTEPAVEAAFRIKGTSPYDAVLLSVFRAILPKHMPEEDKLTVGFKDVNFSESDINSAGSDTIKDSVLGINLDDCMQTFHLVNLRRPRTIPEKIKEVMGENEEWAQVSRVTQFFKTVFDVACYVYPEKKATLVVACNLDVSRLHYMLCALFAFFPWYFADKKVSAEEKDLLQSLRNNTPDKFHECLKKFEGDYDFYSIKLESLDGFETSWMAEEKNSVEREVFDIDRYIEELSTKIASKLREREDKLIRIAGISAKMAEEQSSGVKDFLIDHKDSIYFVDGTSDYLTFEVITDLMYWDADFAETLLKNKRSSLYTERGSTPRLKSKEMAELFRHIFVDGDIKLQMCAAYRLNIRGRYVEALSGFAYSGRCFDRCPNPHIDRHHCLGGYASALEQAMRNHDYVLAITQCIASCQSVNLLEEPSFNPFIKWLYSTNKKVCRMPDGTTMSPAEAAKVICGKEENEDEQADQAE